MENKQTQKAGDGSQQLQMVNPTFNVGITEARAREIFSEMNEVARRDYTSEAFELACKRVSMFEELLMSKVEKVDGMLEAFGDPSFQFLLTEAQRKAAASEREMDYGLLSELLACRVQKGGNRKHRAGIAHAVKIVDEIDDDALCALTVAHAVSYFMPTSGECTAGLNVLDSLFDGLLYQVLPDGNGWLDHLDILGAIRISSFGEMKKFHEYYPSNLNGYACVGIRENSEEHKQAVELLTAANISSKILVKNECLDGFLRLCVVNRSAIGSLALHTDAETISLNDKQKKTLEQIWDLYTKNVDLEKKACEQFMEIWDSFESLHKIRLWWEAIPSAFSITQVGKVLAHTNAKRCVPEVPDLI